MLNLYSLALQSFSDDGFVSTAAEPWFLAKSALIRQSAELFISRLAAQVDEFIWIDLFAGNGFYSVGSRKERWPTPSLLVMQAGLPFSKWILCERDKDNATALRVRTRKYFKGKAVLVFEESLSALIEKLTFYVPVSSRKFRVAALCLADSFSFEFPFVMVERLSALKINYLIPFTFCLNEQNDYRFYLKEQSDRLARFLGKNIHETSLARVTHNQTFYKQLVRLYHQQMLLQGLGGSLSVHPLDSGMMELPSYYMGLFTPFPVAQGIQRQIQNSHFTQISIFSES